MLSLSRLPPPFTLAVGFGARSFVFLVGILILTICGWRPCDPRDQICRRRLLEVMGERLEFAGFDVRRKPRNIPPPPNPTFPSTAIGDVVRFSVTVDLHDGLRELYLNSFEPATPTAREVTDLGGER
jgi:hypothetical protein